jgi:hypothetical protein
MSLWIDSNKQVHDDMDGAALELSSWPKGMTPYTMPTPTAAELLAAAQQTQLAVIDSAYVTAIQQPVTYMNTTFQADKDSQDLMLKSINWLKSIVDIGETIPADFGWWDTTNVKVPMTLEQLQGLYVASGNIANSAFTHKQDLKAAIRAATKVTAVTKIVW